MKTALANKMLWILLALVSVLIAAFFLFWPFSSTPQIKQEPGIPPLAKASQGYQAQKQSLKKLLVDKSQHNQELVEETEALIQDVETIMTETQTTDADIPTLPDDSNSMTDEEIEQTLKRLYKHTNTTYEAEQARIDRHFNTPSDDPELKEIDKNINPQN